MIIKNDRHLYPLKLVAGDTSIKFGSTTVHLPPGTYYAHKDAAFNPGGAEGLYRRIILSMQTAFPGRTFDVIPQAPANYPRKTGIRLVQLSGAAIGPLDLSGTSTIIKRALGFAPNDIATYAWSSGKIDSPFSAYGQWMPWSCFDGRASSKDSYLSRDSEWSSPHPEVATAIIWRERRVRLIRYEYVFGCYINQNRAQYEQLASYAGLNVNDFNNSLENLWSIAGRNNDDILVVYDLDEIDLRVVTHKYEIVRFADKRQTESMESITTRIGVAHDFWNINLAYVVLGGNNYGQ